MNRVIQAAMRRGALLAIVGQAMLMLSFVVHAKGLDAEPLVVDEHVLVAFDERRGEFVDVAPLRAGRRLVESDLPVRMNIRANVRGDGVGRVGMILTRLDKAGEGAVIRRIERHAPYLLHGSEGWAPLAAGRYLFSVEVFAPPSKKNRLLWANSVEFAVEAVERSLADLHMPTIVVGDAFRQLERGRLVPAGIAPDGTTLWAIEKPAPQINNQASGPLGKESSTEAP